MLEDPDAIPDGLKPATNGDLYIATVLTGGVNVVGADGTDKGLLKGFGDYVSNVQFRGIDALRDGHRRRHGRRQRVPRLDLAHRARRRRQGSSSFPGHDRLGKEDTRLIELARQWAVPGDESGGNALPNGGHCERVPRLKRRASSTSSSSGQMSRDEFIERATAARHLGDARSAACWSRPARRPPPTCACAGRWRAERSTCWYPPRAPSKGVQDKIGEIKKRFGIDVKMTALAVGPLNEKLSQSVKAHDGHLRRDLRARLHRRRSSSAAATSCRSTRSSRRLRRATASRSDFAAGELKYSGYFNTEEADLRRQDAVPDPGPLRRPDHPVLPQGPAPQGRHRRADDLDRVPRRGEEAERQRDRRQHDDREVGRRLDVPRRLVHALRRAGRQADERLAAGEELHAPADEPAGGRGARSTWSSASSTRRRASSPTTSRSRPTRSAPARRR